MKNRKFLVLLLLFMLPVIADAKSCTVVKGTGNNIGDEIACGSEHFYVLEKNDDNIKLLSKYNLYVGEKIEKDPEIYNIETSGDLDAAEYDAYTHCVELQEGNPDKIVETTGKYNSEGEANEFFCRIFTPLEYDKVKQSKLAIGLYPNAKKEVAYPIYGSVYLDVGVGENEFDENLDLIPENSPFNTYLSGYKTTLTDIGVDVLDIGFIKKSGIENFINSVSDKEITIPTYYPGDPSVESGKSMWEEDGYYFHNYGLYITKFNIKEYVPAKYSWIYGTSYWVGSATALLAEDEYYDEFLTTVGDYCSYTRGCRISNMGIGLRPVITISADEIDVINPKTSDNMYLYLIIGIFSVLELYQITTYTKRKEN